MIELVDDCTVVELFSFIHPKYSTQQNLYFNKSCEMMIEWLNFDRVFLYQK